MRRCFLCRADMLAPTRRGLSYPNGSRRIFSYACGSCGMLLMDGADPEACRGHLDRHLRRLDFVPDPQAPYGLDLYTLRIAATGAGRGARPVDAQGRAALAAPHSEQAACARLFDLTQDGVPVSLGLPCRPGEVEQVLASLPVHAAWTDDAVILVDAEPAAPHAVAVPGFPPDGVRLAARPLAGDFASQRNALQVLARRPWMLQLDADERLDPRAGGLLPALAALAQEGAVLSVGLARANLVDGVLSDVYPDVQYRLNRAEVPYAGRVHERPACGGWQRSFISLHGTIEHILTGAHVRSRSRAYEALAPGCGRLEEEEALLRPYRD